ncbi:MAG: 3-phosphoshikimate 1-carboxyvinyltransferase, partial [Gammaproteobacteria bacterium]
VLDCGNSGTAMRLLTGILAAQSFDSTLTGDASLTKRPMQRVINPLGQMGAKITAEDGKAPLFIRGGQSLQAIHWAMPVASAQVKSSLLLAGMYAQGETVITEPDITRDHTERMLASFDYPVNTENNGIRLCGGGILTATEIKVPSDLSSAAFFIVAAIITPGSDILLRNIGINPTRTGVIEILRLMGADIKINNERNFNTEPVADIRVQYSKLHGIEIPRHLVSLAIDEFPILFIAAAQAQGETVLHGAQELRFKESDRIQAMVTGLQSLGIKAQALDDGAVISGGVFDGGEVDSQGDHRIAMAFAMAGICAKQPVKVHNCANVATSFSNFIDSAQNLGVDIVEEEK